MTAQTESAQRPNDETNRGSGAEQRQQFAEQALEILNDHSDSIEFAAFGDVDAKSAVEEQIDGPGWISDDGKENYYIWELQNVEAEVGEVALEDGFPTVTFELDLYVDAPFTMKSDSGDSDRPVAATFFVPFTVEIYPHDASEHERFSVVSVGEPEQMSVTIY